MDILKIFTAIGTDGHTFVSSLTKNLIAGQRNCKLMIFPFLLVYWIIVLKANLKDHLLENSTPNNPFLNYLLPIWFIYFISSIM